MLARSVALAVVLPALLAGCLGSADSDATPSVEAEAPRILGTLDANSTLPCGLAVGVRPATIRAGEGATIKVALRNCSQQTLGVLGDACSGLPGVVLTREGAESGVGSAREPWILDASGPAALSPRVCASGAIAPWTMPPGHAHAIEIQWNGLVPIKTCAERCETSELTLPPGSYHLGTLARAGGATGETETLKDAARLEVWSPTLVDEPTREVARGEAPNDDAATLLLDNEREWERFTTRADASSTPIDFATERIVTVVLGKSECRAPEVVSVATDDARGETLVRWRDAPVDGCEDRVANQWIAVGIPAKSTRVTFERVAA